MSPTRPGGGRPTEADRPPGGETSSSPRPACSGKRAGEPPTRRVRGAGTGADLRWAAAAALQHRIAALLWRALDRAGVADARPKGSDRWPSTRRSCGPKPCSSTPSGVSIAVRPLVDLARRWVALRSRLLREAKRRHRDARCEAIVSAAIESAMWDAIGV